MRPWLLLLAAYLAVNAAGEQFATDASSGRYSVIQRYNIASGLLHLEISAVAEDKANPAIDRRVVYDLHKHKMTAE